MSSANRSDDGPAGELHLDYPATWTYTIFGKDEARLRAVVTHVVRGRPHTLSFSHRSPTGKYCSFRLDLTVESDEQRLEAFRLLHDHHDVRYVL